MRLIADELHPFVRGSQRAGIRQDLPQAG
jgi:hypothetical protein